MDSIDGQDLERSFSFSSEVSVGLFSDEEDEDDTESYIEICLKPKQQEEEEEEEAFQFCISDFSGQNAAALTLFLNENQILPLHNLDDSEKESTFTSGSSETRISSSDESTPEISSERKVNTQTTTKFPTLTRKTNLFLWSWKKSGPEMGEVREEENGCSQENRQLVVKQTQNQELIRSSKASKITTAINGSIMKFLIKFRSLKLRSSLVSGVKAYNFNNESSNTRTDEGTSYKLWRIMSPFNKWLVQRNNNMNNVGNRSEKTRVMDINVDDIKGVLEAMKLSIGFKYRETKSCPPSVKSSPIQKGLPGENRIYARENSIHAAIAHCKRSCGETPDLCF